MAQRYRWVKLLLIAFAISVSAIIAIVLWVNDADPRVVGRGDAVESWLFPLLSLFLVLGVVGVVILIIKYAVKSGIQEAKKTAPPNPKVVQRPSSFPVVTRIPEYAPPIDGPGRYHIQGVNRSTKADVTHEIQADSLTNAKIKAELDDVIVTSVTKI